LESAQIHLFYPWVEGETHEVTLLTSTGLTFSEEIAVAVESPRPNWTYFGIFTLLGVYVGVIPVFLGLLWFPAMRNVSARGLNFLLSLTVGLLAFLAVDALHEALEVAEELPKSYEGVALITVGFAGSLLLLMVISRWSRTSAAHRGETFQRMVLAYTIALGIGLHNLGEGLAIGSAYALGNIALGGVLVIGFAIHNTTEGFAIVAPVAKQRVAFANFIWMGVLAGVPTILGTWIGGFTYSAVWSVLFLGIGAGAIVQVIYVILRQMARQPEDAEVLTPRNVVGLLVGFMIMYATGVLVTF
jgi:zinc transporter ZupT